jgi:hypothetical protein
MGRLSIWMLSLVTAMGSMPVGAEATSRLFPYYKDETEILRLAQVMGTGSRHEILEAGMHYRLMLAAGIPDEQLVDGSLAIARVYCCGGATEVAQAIWLFVPPGTTVKPGDVVEVRMGRQPEGDDAGLVNQAVAIRQRPDASGTGTCSWQPDDPKLPTRTLYCDGIEQEGWVKREGLREMWVKLQTEEARPTLQATAEESAAAPTIADPAAAVSAAAAGISGQPDTCLLVVARPELHNALREAAGKRSPPLQVVFEGEPGSEACSRKVELQFNSVVDRSGQRRNRDGTVALPVVGFLLGSITPWTCPTTHTAFAAISDHEGSPLGTSEASRLQKRVGTMLACSDVESPSDEFTALLMGDVLDQMQASGILPTPVEAVAPAAVVPVSAQPGD